MNLSQLLSFLYLFALVAVGWRLVLLRWPLWARLLAGAVLVVVTPLLFIVPALLHPERSFADLQLAIGIGMLVAGLVSLLLGSAIAWFWNRRKRA